MTTLATLLPAAIEQHLGWYLFFAILLVGLIVGARDLAHLSLKRIWAISSVCFAESIRRRVLLITPLAIVGVIIVSQLQRPLDEQDVIRQTIMTALFATGLLVAVSTIILACTNLPREIENRVIYTVVTKPTTRLEIVIGKVLGFIRVSGVILIIMGVFTYGYLRVREWSLRDTINERIASKDTSASSLATLVYYRDAGLLSAKTLETPDSLQIYAKLPDATTTRRYFSGGGEGSVSIPFDITPETQKALDPQLNGGQVGMGVLINVGYVKRADAANKAATPATKPVTASPTTRPYYGPFIMSPEERAAILRGNKPSGVPNVAIEVMDANLNNIGPATPVGAAKTFDLPNPDALITIPAILEPKVTNKIAGRVYVRIAGMSPNVDYFIDQEKAPAAVLRLVTVVNGQPKINEIAQAADANHPDKPATPVFQSRAMTVGQQLRGGTENAPIAIYEFRDVKFSASNDEAPFELRVGVERSGSDETSTETAVQPTRVAVQVHNLSNNTFSNETVVQPESNRTLLFTLPASTLDGGNFDVLLRCLTPGDFLGMQDKSLSLITSRQFFAWNLFKSMLILWLMSILITTIAIFASTFLSWPIAVVLTIVMLLGHWGVEQLGDSLAPGIGSQVVTDFGLKGSAKSEAVRATVEKLSSFLNFTGTILPDISKFPAVEDIERGVAIPTIKLEEAALVALGFSLPLVLLAYVILKNKEVAP